MNTPFQMPDGMDFMKQIWGNWSESMNLPGVMTPTLDVEEIDRRVNDLKTIEHWLNVNLGMLRNTIQTLEVQRATLATLKSFSQQFEQPTHKSQKKSSENATATAGNPWWNLLQQQFTAMAQANPPTSPTPPVAPSAKPADAAPTPQAPRARKAHPPAKPHKPNRP